MSHTTHGGRRPDLVEVAHRVHGFLEFYHLFGDIPFHATLRVLAVDDARIAVLVGGLDDEWLAGMPDLEASVQVTPPKMTLPALRLMRFVQNTIACAVPFHDDGCPMFPVLVWFQTEAQARKTALALAEGVTVVRGGEVVG